MSFLNLKNSFFQNFYLSSDQKVKAENQNKTSQENAKRSHSHYEIGLSYLQSLARGALNQGYRLFTATASYVNPATLRGIYNQLPAFFGNAVVRDNSRLRYHGSIASAPIKQKIEIERTISPERVKRKAESEIDALARKYRLEKVTIDKKTREEFAIFVGKHRPYISTNQKKIKESITMIHSGQFDLSMCDDKEFPFTVMAAYYQGAIDKNEISMALDLYYARKSYAEDLHVLPIFQESGEISPTVRRLLFSTLKNSNSEGSMSCNPTASEMKNFIERMRELPPSQQQLYIVSENHDVNFKRLQEMNFEQFSSDLQDGLKKQGENSHSVLKALSYFGFLKTKGVNMLFLPLGAQNALHRSRNLSDFDIEPRLGRLSPRDILQAEVQRNARPRATFFPGIKNISDPHGFRETPLITSVHDDAHWEVMQSYPVELRRAMFHIIDLIQKGTGIKMSKEIWEMTDMFFIEVLQKIASFRRNGVNPNRDTLFFHILTSHTDGPNPNSLLYRFINNVSKNNATDIGWILFLDMHKNRENWEENFNVITEDLPLEGFFKIIEEVSQAIENFDDLTMAQKVAHLRNSAAGRSEAVGNPRFVKQRGRSNPNRNCIRLAT